MPSVHHPDTPRNRGDLDAPHMSPITPAEDARTILINKISWSAVLAGVVVALVTQLILNMLGIGIGAATLDPMTGDNPSATSFSIGAGLWFSLSGILAALAGGYAAGRLAGKPKEIHCWLAWSDDMGPDHPRDLLPAHFCCGRHSRWYLSHRDQCTRECRDCGRFYGSDRSTSGGTQSGSGSGPFLLN